MGWQSIENAHNLLKMNVFQIWYLNFVLTQFLNYSICVYYVSGLHSTGMPASIYKAADLFFRVKNKTQQQIQNDGGHHSTGGASVLFSLWGKMTWNENQRHFWFKLVYG